MNGVIELKIIIIIVLLLIVASFGIVYYYKKKQSKSEKEDKVDKVDVSTQVTNKSTASKIVDLSGDVLGTVADSGLF